MLPRTFFDRPVLTVAADLLGCEVRAGDVTVRLTEVEAYEGTADPASHAYRGPTPRTQVMFGPPGFLYVYFTYGMHWCANLVCGPDGTASAVLLRAGEVVAGHDVARKRRPACRADRDLARGPARLASCLGLTGADSGMDICRRDSALTVGAATRPVGPIESGPRVGIRSATERPWRFWLAGDPTVSVFRPGGARARRGNGSRADSAVRQTGGSQST